MIWAGSALYVWSYLDRGWVPHDEGSLGQSAERILQGELPHRDFDEIYTGGLSYVHAATFELLTVDLRSMRRALFVAFLAWLPAVYYIATRFSTPAVAALVTLLCVTWSLPNYSAPIPSWYNLILASFAVAGLLRFLETRHRRWLMAAGVCCGLSCLVKIVGFFFLLAAGLALLFWEQIEDSSQIGNLGTGRRSPVNLVGTLTPAYSSLVVIAVSSVVMLLALVSRSQPSFAGSIHFVLPTSLLALVLMRGELGSHRFSSRQRFRRLAFYLAPFSLGLAIVVVPFLMPYLTSGAVSDLLLGLFISPGKRLTFASVSPPAVWTAVGAVPFVTLLVLSPGWKLRTRRVTAIGLAIPLGVLLINSDLPAVYQLIFTSMRALVPLVAIAGSILLWRRRILFLDAGQTEPLSSPLPGLGSDSRALFTLLAVASLCSWVQFPFSAPIYFFYVAPLGALALLAVLSNQFSGPRPIFVVLVVFCMLYAVVWVNPGFIYSMGIRFVKDDQTEMLEIDRGGLRISGADKSEYEALVSLIRRNATGEYIFATPDCPEVYFLSGKKNPTRTTFDFFDDPADRVPDILAALDQFDVQVVILNRRPAFSGAPPSSLLTSLRRRYPNVDEIGRFEVRWKR